jgi:hypothetical protein
VNVRRQRRNQPATHNIARMTTNIDTFDERTVETFNDIYI